MPFPIGNEGMEDLGNCAACRVAFTDVAQMHTCKGCQGTIHSYVVCKSKCPKVDGHEEDNWCSQECLVKDWPYGGQKPAMPYGGKKDIMPPGGTSRAESRAGGIMTPGRRNSDFSYCVYL